MNRAVIDGERTGKDVLSIELEDASARLDDSAGGTDHALQRESRLERSDVHAIHENRIDGAPPPIEATTVEPLVRLVGPE